MDIQRKNSFIEKMLSFFGLYALPSGSGIVMKGAGVLLVLSFSWSKKRIASETIC